MAESITKPHLKIPEEDILFYEKSGWYISDLILDDATIERCIAAAEKIYDCDYDRTEEWSNSPHIKTFNVPYTDRTKMRVDQFPSFLSDPIREVVHSPEVAELTAQLLRSNEIRYYKDILIGTPAQGPNRSDSAIGWHTDISYWPTCIPERMITVYIPLQDRDEHNGTLAMVKGSQEWANLSFNITAEFDEFDKLKNKFEREGHPVDVIPLRHKRGQVSFHSSMVIHSTYPNTTPDFQYSIVFGLQASDNRYVPSKLKRLNPSIVVNLNDEIGPLLEDGSSDVKNDDFYPVLYPQQH